MSRQRKVVKRLNLVSLLFFKSVNFFLEKTQQNNANLNAPLQQLASIKISFS